MKEFFASIGNQFVVVHGWVGLMYVPFESIKRPAPLEREKPHEQVLLMAVPFTQ